MKIRMKALLTLLIFLNLLSLNAFSQDIPYKTLEGHSDPVLSLVFSPDGLTLASGGVDETIIRLWDAKTGALRNTLEGHTQHVNSVAYSPDGQTLASGSHDGTIRLWDANTGALQNTLEGHNNGVLSVAYGPDGQTLASGSYDKTVRLWDAKTGELLNTLEGHTQHVNSVAYGPDGQTLASGSYDKTVRLWDAKTGELLNTLWPGAFVFSVAYSPDGQALACGSQDDTILLWDAKTGELLNTLEGHTGGVFSVAYSPDGQTLASGGHKTFLLWDAKTGELLNTLAGGTGWGWWGASVAYSPDGLTVACGGYSDNTILLWDAKTGAPLRPLGGHAGWVNSVAYSPDGLTLASGSSDPNSGPGANLCLWDAHTGALLNTLGGHKTMKVNSVAYSPDGLTLASGTYLWDAKTGEPLNTIEIGWQSATDIVAYSPDGLTLASGRNDTIRLWDAHTGALRNTLEGHTGWVNSVAYSPDGLTLASGGRDIRLWDAKTGALLRTLGHTRAVSSIVYSPDGLTLASGSGDDTIRLWDAKTGALLRILGGHTGWVNSVAYSPDGLTLASGSYDKTIRLWDAKTGALLNTLEGHTRAVNSVAFSPDGRTLASGSYHTIRLWELSSVVATAGEPEIEPVETDLFIEAVKATRVVSVEEKKRGVVATETKRNAPPGGLFTLHVTVRNQGTETSTKTAIIFYQSTDNHISTDSEGDKAVGTIDVGPLLQNGSVIRTIDLAVPETGGVFYYGACIRDPKSYTWVCATETAKIDVTRPEVELDWIKVGPKGISPGELKKKNQAHILTIPPEEEFDLLISLTNKGKIPSTPTRVTFYRSSDTHISTTNDEVVATIDIEALEPGEHNRRSRIKAPKTLGTYYYGACVEGNACVIPVTVIVQGLWPEFISQVAHSPDGYTYFVVNPPAFVNVPGLSLSAFEVKSCSVTLHTPDTGYFMFPLDAPKGQQPLDTLQGGVKSIKLGYEIHGQLTNALVDDESLGAKIKKGVGIFQKIVAIVGVVIDTVIEIVNPEDPTAPPTLTITPSEGFLKTWLTLFTDEVLELENFEYKPFLPPTLFVIREPLSSIDITVEQVYNIYDDLPDRGDLTYTYRQTWSLKDGTGGAPSLRPMSLADYPPFQSLPPEVQEYLLWHSGELGNAEAWQIPQETSLLSNYPNPFNPETWIPYQLSEPADVALTIYDINGRVVRDLGLGHQRAGMYHNRNRAAYWDGKNAVGEPVASGLYFYTLTAGEFTATRKMLIRK